jgi:hypothetical protein
MTKLFEQTIIFFLGISSLITCIHYNFTKDITLCNMLIPPLIIYSIIDIYFHNQIIFKIHHMFCLGIIFYNYYFHVTDEDKVKINYYIFKTEITSVFLILKQWLNNRSNLYNINAIIFYLLFLKFRIIDFYYNVISYNSSIYYAINKYSKYNYFHNLYLLISCYGLYVLNLYWFLIINKIVYKQITKIYQINKNEICEYLCSYIHIINIPICIYIYSYNKRVDYLLNITGVTVLTISSYFYHYNNYQKLRITKIDNQLYPTEDDYFLFINDNLSIHFRSFLSLVTSYYYNKYFTVILMMSSICHLISIYFCVMNMFLLFLSPRYIKENFLKKNQKITAVPILFDIFCICIKCNKKFSIPLFLNIISIYLLLIIKPFDKLNHVGLHILLIIQNYYSCLSHLFNTSLNHY